MRRATNFPYIVFTIIAMVAMGGQFARADAPSEAGAKAYIAGIEDLEHADYRGAVAALTQAIQADGEDESYRRVRGVAYTLSESFDNAIADLQRAQRLDATDTEARLWIAAAYRMSGDVAQGASNFTMSNLPHDYANMVYNVMAMQYWQSRFQGHYYDPATRTQVQASGPVKTHFAEVARIYAQRHRATGAAATAVITEQMQEAIAQSNWEPALRDLVQLRENAPNDPALRGDWAQALLGAGNALQAREEFTRTLCVMPLWAQGYLGRAQAHLMLGDNPRAQADLEVAASLGAGTLDDLRQRLSGFAAPPAPAEAVGQFEAEAQADADFVKIVDDALAVHRLSNAQRQRYDEAYQLRIRVLSEAMRDHAQSAD